MDLNAIATALATKYASLTPPTGLTAIRTATANPPQAIGVFPFVLVTVAQSDEATFTYGGGLRSGVIPFTVDFFMDKAARPCPAGDPPPAVAAGPAGRHVVRRASRTPECRVIDMDRGIRVR